jgi:glutathione-regulated potassium-efflux system ancillary protein KefF
MPALQKEWIDTVLLPGWAYGPGATALAGKPCLLALTTGTLREAYSEGGVHGRALEDYLPAYRQTAALCGMLWQAPHILYGAHHVSADQVQAHVDAFGARLAALAAITPSAIPTPLTAVPG